MYLQVISVSEKHGSCVKLYQKDHRCKRHHYCIIMETEQQSGTVAYKQTDNEVKYEKNNNSFCNGDYSVHYNRMPY